MGLSKVSAAWDIRMSSRSCVIISDAFVNRCSGVRRNRLGILIAGNR